MRKRKNRALIVAAALILLALALFLLLQMLQASQPQAPPHGPAQGRTHEIKISYSVVESRDEVLIRHRSLEVEAQITRILTGRGTLHTRATPLPAWIFADLPPFPYDFYRAELLNSYNHITDAEMLALNESYWKQPEWYPGFELAGMKMMNGTNGSIGAVMGYGAYKADARRIAAPGEKFTDVFFVHAGWNVKSYQGFMLVADYDSEVFDDVRIEPEVFLLTPTSPAFTANWTQKVVVSAHVREAAKPGNYNIGFDVAVPPAEWSAQWREPYTYAEPTIKMGFGRPLFSLEVQVAAK
jgi:hypothetical protein